MNNKYTYDQFLGAAKDSENIKSTFIRRYRRLYEYSKQTGWYQNYNWIKPAKEGRADYLIYCYKDEDRKAIYVGLTCNLKKRHYGHRSVGSVHEFFGDRPIPAPLVLNSGLSSDEARKQEGDYVDKFRKEGWLILNRAKTGKESSSLGGYNTKLTYQECWKIAKQYKTKTAFQRGDVSAYRKALDKGWLDRWFKNVNRKKWTRERCYSEAHKYHSRSEFRIKSQSAYNSALKNGWLEDYCWFVRSARKSKWNEDACYQAAKKCCSRSEFAKRYSSAYKVATKNGWVSDYDWFKSTSVLLKGRIKWTYEACRREAQKYKTRWEFGEANSGAYHACLRNHWLDSFGWLQKK